MARAKAAMSRTGIQAASGLGAEGGAGARPAWVRCRSSAARDSQNTIPPATTM